MTTDRPDYLVQGERARLFPVLAETSREGRATSVFLASLAYVDEYADRLLGSLGRKVGKTSRVANYTEVVFRKCPFDGKCRPDGLITVRTGNSAWSALVETKIANATLAAEQITNYLKLARENGVDAVITISNDYATSPDHHPVAIDKRAVGKVDLYHWSWMHLLTEADLLLTNDGVSDLDQRIILNELRRFLSHESTGVKGFDRMPAEWPELVRSAAVGGRIAAGSAEVRSVVSAWQQETSDLCLLLSRQTGVNVSQKLARAERNDNALRLKRGCDHFVAKQLLETKLVVPGAAREIDLCVDVRGRSIMAAMRLDAPEDRKGSAARINWLIRQLADVEDADVHVRVHWPRVGHTQHKLSEIRTDVDIAAKAHPDRVPVALEVCRVWMPQGRFSQVRNFIVDIEDLVSGFYADIGQNLKSWQKPAPKTRADRRLPEDVAPAGLREDAEEELSEGWGGTTE